MRLRCRFDYYPQPLDPHQYIRPVIVDVLCSSRADEEVVAGRLAIDHLDLGRAALQGKSVLEICDADSAAWESVYTALFEPAWDFAEIRRDFEFDDAINHVLFLHHSVFHPRLRDWQSFIVHHVSTLFGADSATVMWKGQTDLSDGELARLGFRMVAGHPLLFRPNMLKHPYDAIAEDLDVFDLEVDRDVEQYVVEEWAKEPSETEVDDRDHGAAAE
jgi:hypothetical protein